VRRPFFVVATDVGRLAVVRRLMRWAPTLFLFSRITGPAVLNHKTRDQIYQLIQQRPGMYYRSILKELSLKHGTLTHHLMRLERENLVRSHRDGLRVRFFPTSIGAIRTKSLTSQQIQILEAVRARPGMTQTELAMSLGMSRQAMHYHIDALRRASLIGVALAGRETRLAVPDDIWARIGRCPRCSTPFAAEPRAGQLRCAVCAADIPVLGLAAA
jgi:predicted transcriptional regulator